ncbi:hypothetical protein C0J52_10935 [Blattella germanica]|nr:hypothetical protein C0J52_10935 [Blattella germanica]
MSKSRTMERSSIQNEKTIQEEVTRAIALFKDDRSIRYIANVLGVARSTVHDAIKRYQETGEYCSRPGSGRPRATNNRYDRVIVLIMLRDRKQDFLNNYNEPKKCLTEDEVLDILYHDDSGDDLIPELDSNSDSESDNGAYRTDIIFVCWSFVQLYNNEVLLSFRNGYKE